MKKFLVGLGIVLVLAIGGVYYALIGVGAKDLGIVYTAEDSQKAREKVGTEIILINKAGVDKKDFTLEGRLEAKFTMDSKELTAFSNNRPWKNYPVKNLQIKIHDDGTIEASAVLVIEKAMPYAKALGYSEQQIRDAMAKYNVPAVEAPIYIKGKGSVNMNNVVVNAQNVKIGLVNIPAPIVERANSEAMKVLDDLIARNSHAFSAEKVAFDKGIMSFEGAVPGKEYVMGE